MVSQQLGRPLSHVIKPSSPTDTGPKGRGQELQVKTRSRLEKEMREELLGPGGL